MQLSSVLAAAVLPLLAAAETSTMTSTMTMTKYVTISKVSTSSVISTSSSANSTVFHAATGTGLPSISSSFVLPTTTTGADGTPTTVAPTISPTIDNTDSGAGLNSANLAFAGLAGIVVAALI
ncbi:hypothetical protein GGR52DRAFT_422629 [Hypoxylon sp. FL1284]|nr:hypothetical protein GGR52DRAFT_422629 [Hypoxylon sp. FL1284]